MAINITTNIGKYKNYFQDIRIFYEQRQDVKIFLEILLSLATIILFSIFAIRPTLLTIGQLLTEIQNKEVTVAKLNEKIENLKTAQVVYESSGGVLSLLDTAIPSETEIEKEVRQIEGLAQKNTVTLSSVSISETPLKGIVKTGTETKDLAVLPTGSDSFNISLNASGGYKNLITFLRDLQNQRRPMVVDQVLLNSQLSEDTQQILMTIKGRSVFEKKDR